MAGTTRKTATKLAHLGSDPARFAGAVNPPVFRASTILAPDLDTYETENRQRFERGETVYGRFGTPTHRALEQALSELEGGADTLLYPSGLSAVATALLTVMNSGDHLLMVDSVYGPTRKVCEGTLKRMGIATTYYDPTIPAKALKELIRPETKAVFLESPGSMTFEMQDIPALTATAKAAGLTVLMDNTWATPVYFQPLSHGVDLSIQAATKYIVGHADAMLGAVTANADWAKALRATTYELGVCPGPDDVYLGLRGLRTMEVRLARHAETSLALARWLEQRPEVHRVLHPALPGDPGHEIWARDFGGSSGLFGVVLAHAYPRKAVAAMLDGLELFGIGSSWGGYESLAIACYPQSQRTASRWDAPGPLLRLHAGLEDPGDLIADLAAGLERLNAAADGP